MSKKIVQTAGRDGASLLAMRNIIGFNVLKQIQIFQL